MPRRNVLTRYASGAWAPAIPLPYHGLRKRCDCGARFWAMAGYRSHYALAHILEADGAPGAIDRVREVPMQGSGPVIPTTMVEAFRTAYDETFFAIINSVSVETMDAQHEAIVAGLGRTAPPLAAQALRQYADQEPPHPEAVAYRTDGDDAEDYVARCAGCSSSWNDDEGGCEERLTLLRHADELERGAG